tara:strand:- start:211 stop:465 length:255 start_codon:yes stop_codon:yes gene_type:complete
MSRGIVMKRVIVKRVEQIGVIIIVSLMSVRLVQKMIIGIVIVKKSVVELERRGVQALMDRLGVLALVQLVQRISLGIVHLRVSV